jgi:hypothetical protein
MAIDKCEDSGGPMVREEIVRKEAVRVEATPRPKTVMVMSRA